MKFHIKGFLRRFDQIRRKLRIWSHLLKKSLMENFLCSVSYFYLVQKMDLSEPFKWPNIVFQATYRKWSYIQKKEKLHTENKTPYTPKHLTLFCLVILYAIKVTI